MKDAVIRYVFDKKKVADKSKKTGLLQIEVRKKDTNVCKYISTGIHLYAHQFSNTNGFTCKNHNNASAITGKGRSIFNEVEAFVLSDECTSLECVRNWNKPGESTKSFIEFMKKELLKSKPSQATYEHHIALIRKLEEFGKIKTFSDLTYSNIYDFDIFLRMNIKSPATLNKRHSTLHRYIKESINREYLNKDPYLSFKMPPKKSKEPVFLLEGEIRQIEEYIPANEKLQKIKDLFIFQIYTGMAYADLMNFSRESVSDFDGHKVIRSNRQKTNESYLTLFLPEAEAIAEKYDYALPRITNQKYNDYLKLLEAGAGITKNLTTHVARHTFATYLLNKDIPIETVSKAMGHSSIKMTQHYAKLLGKKVVEDMKKLL